MFSIGLRGRFGSYNHHELALARQKQDFGKILTRIRTTRSDEASSRLLSADQSQDHGSTSQTALESRQAGIPLSRLDSSGSPSRQDTSSSADLSGIDRTRKLVKLILDSDDIKRNLVASEFLELTEAEFQDVLDAAAIILHRRTTWNNLTFSCHFTKFICLASLLGLPLLYFSMGSVMNMISPDEYDGPDEKPEMPALRWSLSSIGTIASILLPMIILQNRGYNHIYDTLESRGQKIRKLRNQFQEFCASIRESGLRRIRCTDTPCSISKESITRFFTYAGLAGSFVVGTGIVGIAPYIDAINCANGTTYVSNLVSLIHRGDSLSQQAQDVIWWVHFSGAYICNITVPLVFMANVFSGLKQDVMELFGGARYRNERVQDTVHSLRTLLARLKRHADFEQFVDDLMCQKYIDSPEFMLMDYASKMELDADRLEMSGLTRDVLDRHGLERTDLAVFCSDAEQVMAALPDRTIQPAEALKLINDLRFDVSFRNRVLNGLKFEDATYSDGWVRFVGGARTLARLGLGWLAMNSLSGAFSSRTIVQHYKNEAGIANNAVLTCALFANKTIPPFSSIKFHAGTASAAAQGIALGNAAMNTLDTGWIMLMMGYSCITAGTRILPELIATTAGGKICEFLSVQQSPKVFFSAALGTLGTMMYVYGISQSCQNNNEVIMLRECPHLSDIPDSPITCEYRGSCYTYMAYIAAALPLPLISDWNFFMTRTGLLRSPVANRNANSDTAREVQSRQEEEDVEQQQETALLTVAAMDQQAGSSATGTY